MSATGLAAFDHTLQETNIWINDLEDRLQWRDRVRDFHALRGVLQALRDHLPVDQVAALAGQFPMLVRGFYYGGWHPHGKPDKDRSKKNFLFRVAAEFPGEPAVDPEKIARSVFRVVSKHISDGEIESVAKCLPKELRELWD